MKREIRPLNISIKIGIFFLVFFALWLFQNQDVLAAVGNWQLDPFEIRGFVNSKADQFGFNQIPDSAALLFDSTNAQKVCEWAGFDKVVSMECKSRFDGRCGYYSCGDNQLAQWNPLINRFEIKNACKQGNKWLSSLVCGHACTSHTSKKCVENSVYWFDSCGNKQELVQTCSANQICQNAQCLNITCSSNSQCGTDEFIGGPFCSGNDVYQNYVTHTCDNPGTVNSKCTQVTTPRLLQLCQANQACSNGKCQNITCSSNSQCGKDGFIGGLFCQGNNVFQNYVTYNCNNPGIVNSFCSNKTNAQLIQACLKNQVCSNGTCTNLNISCSSSSDCGTDGIVGGPYCQGNNVYENFKKYTCNNPGTPSSFCTSSTKPQLKQTCSLNQQCTGGSCTNLNIVCSSNSDCGTNGLVGGPYCQGNSVYENFRTYTCNNPGTPSSYCTNSTNPQLKQNCSTNQTCSGGSCTNLNIACSSNSECGTNGYTGGPFCQGNSIYRNYATYTCQNPGTANSHCTNSTSAQLVQNCSANQTCSGGSCSNLNITCNSNSDCGTNGFTGGAYCQGNSVYENYRTYICNNPGTSTSYCTSSVDPQLKQTCSGNQTCSGGSCTSQNISCYSNSDCGSSGYTGSAFCQGNSVYRNYVTYTCQNPGTSSSYCTNSTNSQLVQTCFANQTCSSGQCSQSQLTSLTVNKNAINLSSGNLNWSNYINANPSDVLRFSIIIQPSSSEEIRNVTVRDTLPSGLTYGGNLSVTSSSGQSVSYYGDLVSGLNIGLVPSGQTITIIYQASVASAQSFSFGTTTLRNNVTVTAQDLTTGSITASSTVVVTRSGVLGATYVPTGFTNNFLVDFFFLPLVIALFGIWLVKSKLINFEAWIDTRKAKVKDYSATKQLISKIEAIKSKEAIK